MSWRITDKRNGARVARPVRRGKVIVGRADLTMGRQVTLPLFTTDNPARPASGLSSEKSLRGFYDAN